MTQIINLEQIKKNLVTLNLTPLIEDGFVAYSKGQVVVPPVGELSFIEPPGDTHIKYGCVKGADNFVIKIASGFYKNGELGLPSNSGLMLVFSSKTGMLDTILLDEGYLTDVRTALAGQIAAKYFAPSKITAIGVLGTGIQARMQIEHLKSITDSRDVFVWGRTQEHTERYKNDMQQQGFNVRIASEPAEVAANSNLIITSTPSQEPLLFARDIKKGTHITAMGSDTPYKQELDSGILKAADLVIADSISQCIERGEISKALKTGCIEQSHVLELGNVIEKCRTSNKPKARTNDSDITVCDLTGVAVQDIQIATAVCSATLT